jgi:hypothetical protein
LGDLAVHPARGLPAGAQAHGVFLAATFDLYSMQK